MPAPEAEPDILAQMIAEARYDDALAMCEAALAHDAACAWAYEGLGDIAVARQQTHTAVRAYQEALRLGGENPARVQAKIDAAVDQRSAAPPEDRHDPEAMPPTHEDNSAPDAPTITFSEEPPPAPIPDDTLVEVAPSLGDWLTRSRARAICLTAVVVVILMLALTWRPWHPRYTPPPSVTPIPIDFGTDGAPFELGADE